MVEFRNPLDTSLKVICKGRESRFKRIMAVCIDHLSRDPERPDVYFCDMGNHRVCKYSVADDTVENIAGPIIMDLEVQSSPSSLFFFFFFFFFCFPAALFACFCLSLFALKLTLPTTTTNGNGFSCLPLLSTER